MKGLDLAREFYLKHARAMLQESFAELMPYIAVGLIGSGSECLGYDDEISTDHDFEAGFCIFLPDESVVDTRAEFALERAYSKLPCEFCGVKRSKISPVGGSRHGVIRLSDLFEQKTGRANARLSLADWLFVPEQSLLELTSGEVFYDGYGELTRVRKELSYMPEDARLKKLAGELLMMAQSGQYNYARCIKRGDTAGAQLCIAELVKSTLHVIFLLNKKYMPYYKWSFKALSELEALSSYHSELEYLISSGNSDAETEKKQQIIEKICQGVIEELIRQKITKVTSADIEPHAYSVNDHIQDHSLRNAHILTAIN